MKTINNIYFIIMILLLSCNDSTIHTYPFVIVDKKSHDRRFGRDFLHKRQYPDGTTKWYYCPEDDEYLIGDTIKFVNGKIQIIHGKLINN